MRSRPLSTLASVALVGISLLLLLPDCASACTCAAFGGSPQQRAERMLDKSAAVFAGKVVDIKRNQKGPLGGVDKVTFSVSESWKGPERGTLELTTQSQGSACGYAFSEGREYLVDATGKMSVSLCSETKPLSEASEIVEALGNGETPREGGEEALTDTSGLVSVRAMVGLAVLSMAASLLVVVRIVRPG
jgi:hypothetical protein